MTDYNDGKWYGWNGGECPVHPETIVECLYLYGGMTRDAQGCAGRFDWNKKYFPIVVFRVIKEYCKPNEIYRVYRNPEGIEAIDFDCLDHAEYYAKRIASSHNPKPRIDIVKRHVY